MKEFSQEALNKMDTNTRAMYAQIKKDNVRAKTALNATKAQDGINKDVEGRLNTLEDARQVQIRINEQFREIAPKLSTPEKKSLWERITGQ